MSDEGFEDDEGDEGDEDNEDEDDGEQSASEQVDLRKIVRGQDTDMDNGDQPSRKKRRA